MSNHMRNRTRWAFAVAGVALLLVAGCGGSDGGGGEDGGDSGDGGGVEFECGGDDHPCSFSETPVEIIERTIELGKQAGAVMVDGGTTADAAAILEADEDVVEVDFDDDAIRFRLAGGREHWIFADSAYGNRSVPGLGGGTIVQALPASNPILGSVVNETTDAKSAIVLSPMLWDFGPYDEGSSVAAIIGEADGYEGRVTYLANATYEDSTIGLDEWKYLDAYDVIHLGTHGAAICDDEGCRGTIMAFSYDSIAPSLPGNSIEDKMASIQESGVSLGQDASGDELGVVLNADFFREYYGKGIKDAVIFLSACETTSAAAYDLIQAITGPDSVYIGWDETVNSGSAADAAVELYRLLAWRGYTVDEAHADIGALATAASGAVLRVLGPDDVRIRDVVRFLDPDSLDQRLHTGDDIPIDGVVGDGEDDTVRWAVRVDGIKEAVASDTQLRVTIDGVDTTRSVSEGERNDLDKWLLQGEMDLGYDLTDDKNVDIEAVVELPEGGESDESLTVDLVGPSAGTWSLQVDFIHTSFREGEASEKVSGSADLILEEDEFQPTDDATRFTVVGGTATVDYNYESPLCIQTGPVLSWTVTEDAAAGSLFKIDRSQDPPVITASINIEGPDFEGEIRCRAGTGADAPPGYGEPEPTSFGTYPLFLSIDNANAQPLNADGTGGSGTVTLETGGDFGSIREMTFTLSRNE